jgi:hypothetical protein
MLTGRRVLFGTAPCVAPKAQGMVSSRIQRPLLAPPQWLAGSLANMKSECFS